MCSLIGERRKRTKREKVREVRERKERMEKKSVHGGKIYHPIIMCM
jgi:hypothetical protein